LPLSPDSRTGSPHRSAADGPQLPESGPWPLDAAFATAILGAFRLVEGRLQVVRRARVPAGAAGDIVAEAEQAVLQALCDAGPLPLPLLAERVRRPTRGVGHVVTSLAARGLVQIGSSAGGHRGRLVSVTRAGRQASHRTVDREAAAVEGALAAWPRAETHRLAELLVSLADSLAPHARD
jgi:DNA-binding MarR family transcriptional regulator